MPNVSNSQLVEGCLREIPDHFQLVIVAACRALELASGATALVPVKTHKPSIVALEEIAASKLDMDKMDHKLLEGFRQYAFLDAPPQVPLLLEACSVEGI